MGCGNWYTPVGGGYLEKTIITVYSIRRIELPLNIINITDRHISNSYHHTSNTVEDDATNRPLKSNQ